ncbi:hypothetical protein HU200_018844 [Digitaria exilis]|uniref:VQ domain-containing protein n=1 Tax=Digitaria exilis TaxID=1010633 RepID=A0A835F569_9POAL|nr:hypothetical protein HU200_018844 [Digitaria exilis]
MEGNSKKKKPATGEACGGGKTARTHWRRRDPADTSVYVVPPDQFRTVVQQLTGATTGLSSPVTEPHHHRQGAIDGKAEAQQTTQDAGGGTGTNAQAQQHAGGGEESCSSKGKTLGQIYDECMAWANADD